MSFRRYIRYRDTGDEWLGEVPDHWERTRLRFVAKLNPSKSEAANLPDDTEVSFLPMEAVGETGSLDLSRTRPVGEVRNGFSYFANGDVVFAKVTPCLENGKGALITGLPGGQGFGTTELTVLRPYHADDGPFLYWLTASHNFRGPSEGDMVGAGGLKRVPDDFVADFPVAWPPPPERKAIAVFLDRETAKIDALVEEQRRLTELLKEKRKTVISLAVTGGFEPAAPLRDSGIDWLGDVPAHWEISTVGHVCERISYGFTNPMPTEEDGPFMLTANDIADGHIQFESARRTSRDAFERLLTDKSRPQRDDVLLTKDGTLGRVALHDGTECCINQSVAFLRPAADLISGTYLSLALANEPYQSRMLFDAGGTTIKHIYISRLAKMAIAIPPAPEQTTICLRAAELRSQFDALSDQAAMAVTLLQERRAALIAAAVTGKIDVRETVAQSVANPKRVRDAVGAEIIRLIAPKGNLHAVNFQKLTYLTSVHVGISEIGGHFERAAAGPYDRSLREELESSLKTAGIVDVQQPGGSNTEVSYRFIGNDRAVREDATRLLGPKLEGLRKLVRDLGELEKRSIEAVATLYAVWNDMLLDGQGQPDEQAVIRGVLEDWHHEKPEKFKPADLKHWLDWMYRNGVVPVGQGPRTIRTQLL